MMIHSLPFGLYASIIWGCHYNNFLSITQTNAHKKIFLNKTLVYRQK